MIRVNRREFCATLAMASATLPAYGSGETGIRASPNELLPREPVSRLSPEKKKLLQAAYYALECLPEGHPWKLESLVMTHRAKCTAAAHVRDIHETWDFLSWHRCFVYFHERTLALLTGRPDFRLPYWDWDSVAAVPDFYCDPQSPLFRPNRRSTNKIPGMVRSADLRALLHSTTFAAQDGFGGSLTNPGSAAIAQPHQGVHWAVSLEMASTETSARDPLFFIHHANMDRYWEIWKRNPIDLSNYAGEWESTWFKFPNEKGKRPLRLRVGDCLDTRHLGYEYKDLQTSFEFTKENYSLKALKISASGVGFSDASIKLLERLLDELKRANEGPDRGTPEVYLTFPDIPVALNESRLYYLYFVSDKQTRQKGPFAVFQHVMERSPTRLTGLVAFNVEDLVAIARGFTLRYSAGDGPVTPGQAPPVILGKPPRVIIRFFRNLT